MDATITRLLSEVKDKIYTRIKLTLLLKYLPYIANKVLAFIFLCFSKHIHIRFILQTVKIALMGQIYTTFLPFVFTFYVSLPSVPFAFKTCAIFRFLCFFEDCLH